MVFSPSLCVVLTLPPISASDLLISPAPASVSITQSAPPVSSPFNHPWVASPQSDRLLHCLCASCCPPSCPSPKPRKLFSLWTLFLFTDYLSRSYFLLSFSSCPVSSFARGVSACYLFIVHPLWRTPPLCLQLLLSVCFTLLCAPTWYSCRMVNPWRDILASKQHLRPLSSH